ncbi:hypothetical protein [Paenibacillus castaneae]|uniref:hypothetical protein n=1 Tax=Paenibacillus castaneae TaxID=474957 RepID=UPI001ABB94B7|nr:hypothetical protein [Paenibacillus castaneae]
MLEQEIYLNFKNFKDIPSIYTSTLFLKHADFNKVSFLIEEAIEKLLKKIQRHHDDWGALKDSTPPNVQLVHDHVLVHTELEVEWLRKLLAYVRK